LISYHYLSPEMKKENYSKFQYQTNLNLQYIDS
jgi:hypothetical protein